MVQADKKRYIDDAKSDLSTLGIKDWPAVATDREKWKTMLETPNLIQDCSATLSMV